MASCFMAEGDLVIERALDGGQTIRSVLIAHVRTTPLPDDIPDDVPIYAANNDVLREITGRAELRDPIACFERQPGVDANELIATHSTFAVLEGINNPNNLGVIMRNAAGLGIGAVLLDPTCGDPVYRRAIRASMGQVFAVPYARLRPFPAALDDLHESGVVTIALTPGANSTLTEVVEEAMRDAAKTAIVLGAEGSGLSDAAIESATHRARIEMRDTVDSLNVASAAAIAFHELSRFRS